MNRTSRLALLAAITLVVALAGTALATRTPVAETPPAPHAGEEEETRDEQANEQEEDEEAPGEEAVQRVVERLGADPARVRELAAEHGFGNAVRLLAWEAEDVPIDEVLARRDAGEGWGEIAKDFGVHPGIGSVMGNGGGRGLDRAPGLQKDRGADD